MKKITYFMVIAVFLGAQILAIDLSFMKLSMYRLSLLLALGGLFLYVLQNNPQLRFYPNKIGSLYVSFYGIWLAVGVLSILWASSLSGWLKANFFIACGFLSIFLINQFIKTKEDLLRIFKIIAGALLLHNVIGWSEIITGHYFFADLDKLDKYKTFTTQPGTRIPISIYANQNDYATMLVAGIFFTMVLLFSTKKLKMKTTYAVLIISSLYLVIRTGSRGNLLAFIIGVTFMLLLKMRDVFTSKGILKGAFCSFTAFILLFFSSSSVRELVRKVGIMLLDTSNQLGDSNHTRLNLIRNGFMFLGKTLGVGVGAGNIEYWMEHNAVFNITTKYNMHNWWMEILTGYGLIIFIFYVTLYILMGVRFFQFYNNSRDSFVRHSSIAMFGYLGAFILSSISSATNIIIEWQWVMFGVMIALLSYHDLQSEKTIKNISSNELGGKYGQRNIN